MVAPLPLRFVTSAPDVVHLPEGDAEVAIVGRSNVGKSSLLNALGNRKDLARASKTPGRTRLLNCFEVAPRATVVDCPGYGYAKAPARDRGRWRAMMETYLLEREPLTMVMVLVDGEIGPTALDTQMLDWLRSIAAPHSVVATKHDKVKSQQRERRKQDLAAGCQLERGDVTWVSAAKGVGIDDLRRLVRLWLDLERP